MKHVEKATLTVELRSVFGKKLKKLRHQDLIPGNVFGQDIESIPFQVTTKDLYAAYKAVRETGVLYLTVDSKEIPVMIKHIQRHPVSGKLLHVDMRKVNLKQKIEAQVPVVTVNESPAVKQGGVLLTHADQLTVEALPADMPNQIEIDLEQFTEVGQEIRVKDIKTPATYTITTDPETAVLAVIEHKEESVEPETTSESPEVAGEQADSEETAEADAPEEAAQSEKSDE